MSRKGETPRDAGPDFSEADLHYSQEIFDAIAPYLLAARPPDF